MSLRWQLDLRPVTAMGRDKGRAPLCHGSEKNQAAEQYMPFVFLKVYLEKKRCSFALLRINLSRRM